MKTHETADSSFVFDTWQAMENKYGIYKTRFRILYFDIENALRILFSKSKFAVKSGKREKDDNFYG